MMVAGLPVLGIVRGGKVRQRHFVRAFFRSKGVALVWRIEFDPRAVTSARPVRLPWM